MNHHDLKTVEIVKASLMLGLFTGIILTVLLNLCIYFYTKDYNCSDFTSYARALNFFLIHQDTYRLDGNNNGIPCEALIRA